MVLNRTGGPVRRISLVTLFGLLAALLPVLAEGTIAQSEGSVTWLNYDVTIDVRKDGSMHVTERQLVNFSGSFSHGFAVIPLNRVEDIDTVSVAVSDGDSATPQPADYLRPSRYDQDPGTFTYSRSGGELSIDYGFERTDSSSTEREVLLEYDVIGGIRVYENLTPPNQQIWWIAIGNEVTDVAPIDQATVTVNLPEAVPADQTILDPEGSTVSGATYTWSRSDMGEGDSFEVRLQVPPITNATVPDWQVRDDQIRESQQQAEERSAFAGTILLGAGLLFLFGGGAGLYALWFTKGRDPDVGKIAEYIPEPPDDLRPGAVGTLLDEIASSREVVATVLDLARRNILTMDAKEGATSVGNEFSLLEHKEILEPYEQMVIDAIFGPGAAAGAKAKLPTVQGSFVRESEEMYDGFYRELIAHQYFREAPDDTRARWKKIFKIVPFVAVLASAAVVIIIGEMSSWLFFPLAIAALVFLGSSRLANSMPSKTVAGAEAAAKWRAFRTYLDDINDNLQIGEQKDIFDKYLPYAVAMGLSERWIHKFQYVDASPWTGGPLIGGGVGGNTWSGGGRRNRRGGNWTAGSGPFYGGTGQFGGGNDGDGGGGGINIPSLQEGSNAAGRGLQGGSNSLFSMLGTVAKAFAESSSKSGSFGSSRGGGFSGGGGSRGGGGGGGRGFG